VRVAAVQHPGEDVGQQSYVFGRDAGLRQYRAVLLRGDGPVAHLAAGRLGDLGDRLAEAEQPRAGELVDLAGVPVLGERRDRDIGDVLGIDERLRDVLGRQRRSQNARIVGAASGAATSG
jgi:hypothetical protein